MKIIYSLFFIVSLIPTIFGSSEEYFIKVDGELQPIPCTFKEQSGTYYGFYFPATVSGFPEDVSFKFLLDEPNDYMYVTCDVKTSIQETSQNIICYVLAYYFPLYDYTIISVPSKLNIFEGGYVKIAGWNGGQVNIGTTCNIEYGYEFIQGDNVPFTVTDDGNGFKTLTSTGSFVEAQLKSGLTGTDPYSIKPLAFVDTNYQNIPCDIYPGNGGDDQIICTVEGTKKVVFFPTTTYSDLAQSYVKFDVHQEVTLYGSFVRLSSILLLSLFLF